jgi:hypothetical protein
METCSRQILVSVWHYFCVMLYFKVIFAPGASIMESLMEADI